MVASERPDRIQVTFDDHRLVANAGLLFASHARRASGSERTCGQPP